MVGVTEVDAIVVGGGPAGATAASVLARAGKQVVVLEKTSFPRYHIGESLLPHCWWTLDRIGVLDAVKAASFQKKTGVRFVTPDGRMSKPFVFTEHLQHDAASTWQVDRATFDRLLLDHARQSGAVVHTDTRATGLVEEGGRVVGVNAEGPLGKLSLRAPWTIDCSGRDGFVRTLRGWKHAEHALDRVAVWSYFRDVTMDEATALSTTVVSVPDDGWFWFIPMEGGVVSVGVVARRDVLFRTTKDLQAALDEQLARNPWLVDALRGATQVDAAHVTADYSYRSTFCADDGVVLAGDAFAFLDPVFSSGVFLALRTGEEAANGVLAALGVGSTSASFLAPYGELVCKGVEAMRALVFSFYDPKFSMGAMVRAYPELRDDVTDLLIGDVFRDYGALQSGLAEFARLPEPLPYGRARVA